MKKNKYLTIGGISFEIIAIICLLIQIFLVKKDNLFLNLGLFSNIIAMIFCLINNKQSK